MGFQKPLEVNDIKLSLLKAHGEVCSHYNDGYTQWEIKKELYQIKWMLEECLKRQPNFSDEDKWLMEQEQKKMWSELKK